MSFDSYMLFKVVTNDMLDTAFGKERPSYKELQAKEKERHKARLAEIEAQKKAKRDKKQQKKAAPSYYKIQLAKGNYLTLTSASYDAQGLYAMAYVSHKGCPVNDKEFKVRLSPIYTTEGDLMGKGMYMQTHVNVDVDTLRMLLENSQETE